MSSPSLIENLSKPNDVGSESDLAHSDDMMSEQDISFVKTDKNCSSINSSPPSSQRRRKRALVNNTNHNG